MIGRVYHLHLLLPVTFRLASQPDLAIEFVVDTGFTGFLTLPPAAVSAMRLPYLHTSCHSPCRRQRVSSARVSCGYCLE